LSLGDAVHHDGWAILGLPPGKRDLGCPELWERSLIRSRERREREAMRRANLPTARKVGFAIAATAVLAPLAQQTAVAQTHASAASLDGMLRKGDRGAAVAAVQRALGIPADGVFGPQTRRAVRAFQARHGLVVDGIVGPATMAALGISGSSGSGVGGTAVGVARSMIGQPYAFGGERPGGFDCSGLMVYAFRQAGITLPRTSYAQFGVGVPVSRANVQAGDLVFFNASGPGASHVGIATSNATAISATTHGVMEHTISGPYWGAHYIGARRP
jgi:cell wall-associated NlpC family hydrolase